MEDVKTYTPTIKDMDADELLSKFSLLYEERETNPDFQVYRRELMRRLRNAEQLDKLFFR